FTFLTALIEAGAPAPEGAIPPRLARATLTPSRIVRSSSSPSTRLRDRDGRPPPGLLEAFPFPAPSLSPEIAGASSVVSRRRPAVPARKAPSTSGTPDAPARSPNPHLRVHPPAPGGPSPWSHIPGG